MTETIEQAQAHLSELVAKVRTGETVVLTEEAGGAAVVRLEAIGPGAGARRLGSMENLGITAGAFVFNPVTEEEPGMVKRLGAWKTPGFELTDAFWEPMSDEECGYGDDGIL